MPHSSFTYESQNVLMGQLDLYYIDWDNISNPTMTQVAVLELPFVHSIPPLPAEHYSWVTPADVAIHISCQPGSSFSSSRPAPYARGPARIFQPVEQNQLLRVSIQLPSVKSELFPGVPLQNRPPNDTYMYVPYRTAFNAVKSGRKRLESGESVMKRVHWEEWAPSARWVHFEAQFWEGQRRATSGTRCMLTRHSTEHHTAN